MPTPYSWAPLAMSVLPCASKGSNAEPRRRTAAGLFVALDGDLDADSANHGRDRFGALLGTGIGHGGAGVVDLVGVGDGLLEGDPRHRLHQDLDYLVESVEVVV